jgi:hypothetical protein
MVRLIILLAILPLVISCRKEDVTSQRQVDINIFEPKAGTTLEKGKNYKISWITDKAEQLRIDLYHLDRPVSIISVSEPNSGQFNWLVPHQLRPDSNYRIRITAANNRQISSFSHFFIISGDSTQKYIQPQYFLNNNWIKGEEYMISWQTNVEEDVKIELLDGNSHALTIAQSINSQDSIKWLVPASLPTSSFYRIKISSTIYPDLHAVSNHFRISDLIEQNLVMNGNFASEDFWAYSNPLDNPKNRWNINKVNGQGAAEIVSFQSSGDIYQVIENLEIGKEYKVMFKLSRCNGYFGGTTNSTAGIQCFLGSDTSLKRTQEGAYEHTFIAQNETDTLGFRIITDPSKAPNSGVIGKLDKVEMFGK